MDCKDIRSRLHAYLDKELDLPSVIEVDRHIASCAACRTMLERQSTLQSGIRRHARYHGAPEALAERIRARLGLPEGARLGPSEGGRPDRSEGALGDSEQAQVAVSEAAGLGASQAPLLDVSKGPRAIGTGTVRRIAPPASRRPAVARWLELGAVAAGAAGISWIVALQYASPSSTETIAEQVIAGHARAVLTSHVVDIETSDQHTVKPWLSSKLDFSPPVVDMSDAGFPLVGGRLDYLDHRPVATLVYHARQHVIDLFVWPDQDASTGTPMQTLSEHGYNVLHWRDAGMGYWAISDLNAGELETFAENYSAAQERGPR